MLETSFYEQWCKPVYILIIGLLIQQFWQRIVFYLVYRFLGKGSSHGYFLMFINIVEKPVYFITIATTIYFALNNMPLKMISESFLQAFYRSMIIIAIFHIIYNLGDNTEGFLNSFLEKFNINLDPILLNLLSSLIHVLTIVLAFLILIGEWGYDTSSLVAGLGLGGLALAMASKDSLSNIFGGFVILMDKPFTIGDTIKASGLEGVVEEVTFRSTRIRTFENDLVYVPNTNLSNIFIVNASKKFKRKATFKVGLSYSTSKEQLALFVERMNNLLNSMEGDSLVTGDSFVAFTDYADSSLDIFVTYSTTSTSFADHSKIKEKINFDILDIVESLGVTMAYPSQSIYFENNLNVEKNEK